MKAFDNPPPPPVPLAALVILPFASTVIFAFVYEPGVTDVESKLTASVPVVVIGDPDMPISAVPVAATDVTVPPNIFQVPAAVFKYKTLIPVTYCPGVMLGYAAFNAVVVKVSFVVVAYTNGRYVILVGEVALKNIPADGDVVGHCTPFNVRLFCIFTEPLMLNVSGAAELDDSYVTTPS